ncbi:MAG: DEAD/DEAH box helicase [Bacteroidales bacterium]|nr:DEAD/DEAH box helicase [Bacteroidales bacterium]
MENKQKIVFVLLPHRFFGHTISPFVVTLLKDNSFSIKSIEINAKNFKSYSYLLDNTSYEIAQILIQCSDDTIFEIFGSHYKEKKEFFKKLTTDRKTLKQIIEYHNRKVNNAITLIKKNEIPIYYSSKVGGIIEETPLYFSADNLKIIFELRYEDNIYKYFINAFIGNKQIFLNFKNTIILGEDPCWIIFNDKIFEIRGINGKKIEPFLSKNVIEIPPNLLGNFLDKFGKSLIENYEVVFSNIEIIEINEEPIPVLKLLKNDYTKTALCLYFKYENFEFAFSNTNTKFFTYIKNSDNTYIFKLLKRNLNLENKYVSILFDLGLQHVCDNIFVTPDIQITLPDATNEEIERSLVSFLNKNYTFLTQNNFSIVNETEKKYFIENLTIEYRIKENIDWFDLLVNVKIGEYIIPFSKIAENIINNNPYLQLNDGSIVVLPHEWFTRLKDVFPLIKKYDNTGMKISRNQYFTAIEILEFENKIYRFVNDLKKQRFDIEFQPNLITKKLREYQKVGVSWLYFLWENKLGGCLADEMGLGKTIQIIAFLMYLKQKHSGKQQPIQLFLFDELNEQLDKKQLTSLLICPLSLVKNWITEIKETAPLLKCFVYNGSSNKLDIELFDKFDLIITTYGNIRRNIDELKNFDFNCIIVDESQYIKNPETKIYNAILQLKARSRFVLTGTPIENSLTDLWAQLNFVNKNMLGNLNFFKKVFFDPIQKQKSKDAKSKFLNIINPFILRRTKKQVLNELPPVTEKICYCPMTNEQQKIYEKRKSEIRNFLFENRHSDYSKISMVILSGLMRLRLIANHPVICEKDFAFSSGKYEEIISHLNKIIQNNYKLVIFSQFVKHLNIYVRYLNMNNIPYFMITGKTSEKQRDIFLNTFQKSDDLNILLMTLKTGGVGLNITAAEYVFLIDPWWNPSVEQQAINRLHRIGQNKHVFAYKFITENSIEEKILKLQENKKNIADDILDYKNFSRLTVKEIEELLE